MLGSCYCAVSWVLTVVVRQVKLYQIIIMIFPRYTQRMYNSNIDENYSQNNAQGSF